MPLLLPRTHLSPHLQMSVKFFEQKTFHHGAQTQLQRSSNRHNDASKRFTLHGPDFNLLQPPAGASTRNLRTCPFSTRQHRFEHKSGSTSTSYADVSPHASRIHANVLQGKPIPPRGCELQLDTAMDLLDRLELDMVD